MKKLNLLSLILLTCMPGLLWAKDRQLETSIDALQKKYSRIRDLHMNFVQSYGWPGRQSKAESGQVYLRRPGLMRWEYQQPREKLFLSDGEIIHFYLPDQRQVQKSRVKNTRDRRIPFMLLLGRGNLKKDFSRIEWARETPFFAGNKLVTAYPKTDIDEFAEVLLEFDPGRMQLQRVAIIERGGARNDFVFTNIRENSGLSESLFKFRAPAGVEVVGLP
jgi:outer membrane lipoprotein carrier protein